MIVDAPAPPPAISRYVTVHIATTGERLSVKKSTFEAPLRPGPRRVFFNPDAHLILGITAFDERVRVHPISTGADVGPAVFFILFALIGGLLLRYGWVEKPAKRAKRGRRR